MDRARWLFAAVVVSIVAALPATSVAYPITFEFGGTIEWIVDETSVLGGMGVGDRFSGTYTFDSSLTDSSSDPTIGNYSSPASVMHVVVGAVDFVSGGRSWLTVRDQWHGLDGLEMTAADFSAAGLHINHMGPLLSDTTGSVFSNDLLPLVPPSITGFDSRFFRLEASYFLAFNGIVDTLTPEPGGMFQLAVGAIILLRFRR
jgi:hypothetical protein